MILDDRILFDDLYGAKTRTLGGPGSGHFGHAGRPGEVGGSAPSDGDTTSSTVGDPRERVVRQIEKVYHGTSITALESIKRDGIKPRGGPGADTWAIKEKPETPEDYLRRHPEKALEQGMTVDALIRDRRASVYVTNDLEEAARFADLAQYVTNGAKAVVLEVEIPKSQLTRDELSHAYRYKGTIRPEWIKRKFEFDATEWVGYFQPEEIEMKALAAVVRFYLVFVTDENEDDEDDEPKTLGGPGSGHFGHAGRPGEVGGSAPGDGWQSAGGWEHTGITWKQDTHPVTGRPVPIKVKTVDEAAVLVLQGKVVEVDSPRTAYTLIDRLAALAEDARAKGEHAPDYDLCNVTVSGTNMFCTEAVRDPAHPEGWSRLEMPQFVGKPVPGSEADTLPRDAYDPSLVNGADAFVTHLRGIGMRTKAETVPAAQLRASQRELVGSKVGAMVRDRSYDPGKAPIFVSNDDYVVDGHHRWAAVVARDAEDGTLGESTINIVRINAPISEILHIGTAWSLRFGIAQSAGIKRQSKVLRTAARRRAEGPLHAIADAARPRLSRLFQDAFEAAQQTLRTTQDVDAALNAMRQVLQVTLPTFLLRVVAGGGAVTATRLPAPRAAETRALTVREQFKFSVKHKLTTEWAKTHAAELIDDVSETSRERIRAAIAKLTTGGDWGAATEAILAEVGDEDRAERIAAHETMLAASEGQRQAWQQAVENGLLTGEERRTWITTGDEKVCPECDALDGETVGLDELYGGAYDGPPAHVSCRCTEGLT